MSTSPALRRRASHAATAFVALHGLPIDRFLVIYAGRIDPEKGVDRALETARLLDPGQYHLAIAGEPQSGELPRRRGRGAFLC